MRRAVVIFAFLAGSALVWAQSGGSGQTPPGSGQASTQSSKPTTAQDPQQNQRITGTTGTTTGSEYTGYAGASNAATGTAQSPSGATGQQAQTSRTSRNAAATKKAPVAKTRKKGENADVKEKERQAIGPPK